jgi:RNase H-fold protein (predicted Holliday junction resolvase)
MGNKTLKESPKVLGLDVSTRTIGWALFDIQSKELLELTHISPVPKPKEENKLKELILKSEIFKTKLLEYKNLGITKVVIEEPLLNSNNIYTIQTLLRFNTLITKQIYDVLGIVPEFISTYNSKINDCPIDDQEDLLIDKYICLGMWMFYPYKKYLFEKMTAEQRFKIRFENLHSVVFTGRVDAVVLDKGKYWIREIKTSGLSPRQFEGRMNASSQVTAYVYAMRKQNIPVQGVIFDVLRKPYIRKRVSETADSFAERNFDCYTQDAKLPERERKLYSRHYIYRSDKELEQFVEDMKMHIKQIRWHWNNNCWDRNQDQCWNFNTLCPYHRICFMDPIDKFTLQFYYKQKGGDQIVRNNA